MPSLDSSAAVLDVAALKANLNLPGEMVVTGLVYDIASGLLKKVSPSALRRAESAA